MEQRHRMDQHGNNPLFTTPDVVIIRDSAGYHLLHGHLHFAMAIALSDTGKVAVAVDEHATIQVTRAESGLVVQAEGGQQPLLVY